MRPPLSIAFAATLTSLSLGACSENPRADTRDPEIGSLHTRTREHAVELLDQSLLDAFERSFQDDLLDPYYPSSQDESDYGGFVENRSGTWSPLHGSKWVVSQARYTWTAAKAAQRYAQRDPAKAAIYLDGAAVGFEFLNRMWGYDYDGKPGMALVVDRDGTNGRIGNKGGYLTYGHGFALFASAAYHGASGNQDALTLAFSVYDFLDENLHDDTYGGYYVSLTDTNKDTNVNIHVLEGLIELYAALPSNHPRRAEVGGRMTELLELFHDSAIRCETSEDCFSYPVMDRMWNGSSSTVSPGHDAELTFLMVIAMETLGQDPLSSPYLEKIRKVVDFTFTHGGYGQDGAVYYTGLYNPNGTVTVIDDQLQWWPQGESLAALCMMQKLFPEDPFYAETIARSWSFIEREVIDADNHGWVRLAGNRTASKASEWHANYHSGRAVMLCGDWLSDHCENGVEDRGETDLNCGGVCAPCQDGQSCEVDSDCTSDACTGGICTAAPTCGDDTCDPDETCSSCEADCGECPPTCGDDTCDPDETCSSCEADCGECPPTCGDDTCDPDETCSSCEADCGECPPTCGDDTCDPDETCSSCEADCGECPPTCGDELCEPGETCSSCEADCGICVVPDPDVTSMGGAVDVPDPDGSGGRSPPAGDGDGDGDDDGDPGDGDGDGDGDPGDGDGDGDGDPGDGDGDGDGDPGDGDDDPGDGDGDGDGDGNDGDAGGMGGADPRDPPADGGSTTEEGGCGCAIPGRGQAPRSAWALLAGAALLLRRRRRAARSWDGPGGRS